MVLTPRASFSVSNESIRAAFALALLAASPPVAALPPGGDGARITISISGTDDAAMAGALDASGNVIMAGYASSGLSALAGITRAGTLDPTLGTNGVAMYDFSNGADALRALVPAGNGTFVGCGNVFGVGTGNDFLIARFLDDGALDATFAGGFVDIPFLPSGSGAMLNDECDAVATDSDGSIVAAGFSAAEGPNEVAVARVTAAGALDTGFGAGGLVIVNAAQGATGNSEAHAIAIQPDGKIVIAGYAGGQFNDELLVMRLNADGTLDFTFGTSGITRTGIGNGEDHANALVLLPNGNIVVAGSTVASDNRRDFVVARFTSAGVLDTTFGTGGSTTTPVGPGDDIAYSLTLMPWGRLIAAGSARISTSAPGTDLALISYNANGSIDRYFGNLGVVMLDVSNGNDVVNGLVKDIDGQHFWAVGTSAPVTSQDFLAVEFGLDDTIFRHGFDSNTAP